MSVHVALKRPTARWTVQPSVLAAAIIAPLTLATLYGAIMLAGTKLGTMLAVAAVCGPVCLYYALTRPMLFPYCLFVLLVPFDNLLDLQAFGTLTKLLGVACGAALLVWLVRSRRAMHPGRSVLAWAVFVVLAAASLMWAIAPDQTMEPLLTTLQLFALYAIVACMPIDSKTLTAVLWTVMISGALAAAYGIYLFHGGADMANGRLYIAVANASGTTSKIDPNHFAASLLVPLVLALVAVVEARSWKPRLCAFVFLAISGAGIALSGSRGAVVAVIAMVIYLLIRSPKRVVIAWTALVGVGVALAYHGAAISRFSLALATGGAGRLEIWKVGRAAFLQHPLLGAGFGNFITAYNQAYMNVSLTKNMYWGQAPHSNIVWIAVELGAVGLCVFLYAWWAQFRSLRSVSPYDPFYPLRTALEAGLIGLFIASLFLGTFTYKYLWLAFMLVVLTRNAWVLTRDRLKVTG